MNKKVTSIFANLGIIFWLIGFLAGDKEGAKQFLNQGLIPSILVCIPVINIVGLVFCIWGLVYAIQENETPLPLFGGIQVILDSAGTLVPDLIYRFEKEYPEQYEQYQNICNCLENAPEFKFKHYVPSFGLVAALTPCR